MQTVTMIHKNNNRNWANDLRIFKLKLLLSYYPFVGWPINLILLADIKTYVESWLLIQVGLKPLTYIYMLDHFVHHTTYFATLWSPWRLSG